MKNSPSYQGHRLYTDQDLESLLNAVALYIAAVDFGVLRVTQYDSSGNEVVSADSSASTGTGATIAGSTASQTLIAANALRKGFLIDNNSSETLYVKYGSGASETDYTKLIKPYESWEPNKNYTGIITGAWSAGVGFCRATELT